MTVSVTETCIPPPMAFADWSPIYEVLPAFVTARPIIRLRLPWGNQDGVLPKGLTMYHAKDRNSPFKAVPGAYINAGFSEAGITEFGLFFVGALKSPEEQGCP